MDSPNQIQEYIPVVLLALVALGFAVSNLFLSAILGKSGRRSKVKDIAYECGMLPEGKASARFSVKFYLVAMLFILFDVELVFMYPWAVIYKEMLQTDPNLILGAMLSFIGILFIGYIYAAKKGAFNWKN